MGTFNNLIVLACFWLLASGLGTWVTFFDQPAEIERLESMEKLARTKQSEVSTLLSQVDLSRDAAQDVITRWKSRYKEVAPTLETHEVIARLNSLTRSGFETFDVLYKGSEAHPGFNAHVFDVTGRAYFGSLYDLVWSIENQRTFYRVKDLDLSHFDLTTEDRETGRPRMQVLVTFEFKVEAYYGGAAGLSAVDQLPEERSESGIDVRPSGGLPPVPASVLPRRDPARNPFYPLILSSIPPNTDGLPELERASLVSIVDGKAAFEIDKAFVVLGVGDPVYLGQIVSVDPVSGRVIARLNKGGIIDEMEFLLHTGEGYRQAIGPRSLAPAN